MFLRLIHSHSRLWPHVENRRLQVGQLEGVSDVDANVLRVGGVLQETVQEKQFAIVFLISHVGVDRHAVVQVKCEGEDRVVDNDHLLAVAIEDDVQVFDEEIVKLDAVRSVKALLEDRVLRVDEVQDLVSVVLLTCGENDNLVPLAELFEHILNVWS